MAETVTRSLPAPFIEAAGKTYLDELTKTVGGIKGIDLSKLYGSQFVAGPGALQTQAEGLSTGLGGLSTFLTSSSSCNRSCCISTIHVSVSARCN
jgi:hypothetical protein